jgi:hypothetical protein
MQWEEITKNDTCTKNIHGEREKITKKHYGTSTKHQKQQPLHPNRKAQDLAQFQIHLSIYTHNDYFRESYRHIASSALGF